MMDDQPQSPRSAYSLEVLDTRVSALERGVSAILDRLDTSSARTDASIAAMRDTMAASRVPQWSVLASFFGAAIVLVGALWGTGISPIKQSIEALTVTVDTLSRDMRADVARIQSEVDEIRTEYLPVAVYNDNRLLSRQERAVVDDRLQAEIGKLEAEFRRAEELAVPRGEHQERWRSIDAAILANREAYTGMIADLQRQIDEVSERQGAVYGQRDIILEMQDRIDRAEQLLRDTLIRAGQQQ